MKQRVLTALVLIPLVLGAILWTCPIGIYLLAIACTIATLGEAARLIGGSIAPYLLAPIAWNFVAFDAGPRAVREYELGLIGLWMAGIAAVWFNFQSPSPSPVRRTLAAVGAGFWCVAPLAILVFIHQAGRPWLSDFSWPFGSRVFAILIPLWAGDTAEYLVGRAWGKHLLAPEISPKKTWEGAIANLLASILAAVLLGPWLRYGWLFGLKVGIAVGIAGQLGDLFESYVKRRAGVKDSGTLLPGHGGLLDRIDSLLFAAPAVALIFLFTPH